MLDIGWPELFIVLVIALLVIGPRDLPRAMHHVGRWVRRARSMTSEFQRHFDEMARDAELDELRDMKRKMSARGIKDEIGKAIDPSGDMREAMDIRAGTPLAKPSSASTQAGNGASATDTTASAEANGLDTAAAPDTVPAAGAKPATPVAEAGFADPQTDHRSPQTSQ